MAKQYFIKTGSAVTGPFTGGQLKQMAEVGTLTRDAFISVDQTKWIAADGITGLNFLESAVELDLDHEAVVESHNRSDVATSSRESDRSAQIRCDVLVSYRRKGGSEIARYVAEALRRDGYSVFLDVDGLGSGSWSDELEQRIAECKDFVPIITDGFFDRCDNLEDVVRKELLHAMENRKNIIPLIATDNPFPNSLSPDIARISSYNGVRYVHEYAPKAIEKLSTMLHSRTGGPERLYSGEAQPRVIVAIVAMLFGAWFGADLGLWPGGLYFGAVRGLFWAVILELAIVIPALLAITFLAKKLNIRADRIYGGSWLPFWIFTIPSIIVLTSISTAFVFSNLGIESYFLGGIFGQIFAIGYVAFIVKFKVWTPIGEAISMIRG